MKRLVITVTGTVAGLAALLSFKTQAHPVADAGPLPSAGIGSSAASTPAPTPTAGSGSGRRSSAPASTSASPTTAAAPRTYTGKAITTRYGVVQVRITVANGKITDVNFLRLTAFDGRSEQINSAAGPQLLQETLQHQTAQVDTVSGASYTSEGYRESLQSAVDEAGLK